MSAFAEISRGGQGGQHLSKFFTLFSEYAFPPNRGPSAKRLLRCGKIFLACLLRFSCVLQLMLLAPSCFSPLLPIATLEDDNEAN